MAWQESRWVMLKLPGGKRRLHVLVRGHMTGATPVVVLHGMGGGPYWDGPLHDELAGQGFAVVAPQLPNHGLSSNASRFRDVTAMVADGLGLLGLKDPHFVGHSFGGLVAYGLAAHPELLAPGRMVVAANSPLGPKYHAMAWQHLVLPLSFVGTDLLVTSRVAAGAALLRGQLLSSQWMLLRTLLLPPPRLHLMPRVLLEASHELIGTPERLHEMGIQLIRYWGGLDFGVTQSKDGGLPGVDRTLWHQPHCSNFFRPMAARIGQDLALVA